jgi:NOL1/NOP2/fmu family ribosome biogenesis protein
LPIYKSKEAFYLCPELPLPAFGVVCAGVCVGTLQHGRLLLHHQLFSAYGTQFLRKVELSCDDPRLLDYLRGLEIPCEGGENGFCAVLADGVAVGGGKIDNQTVKNHYPKGLRNH